MSQTQEINFTLLSIELLPVPVSGRSYYKDSQEKGLSLYITQNGIKTFFIRKRVRGRDERIILGSPELVPVEKARNMARIIKQQIADGLDPISERKKLRFNELTLGQHFTEYMELYSKKHKKSWKYDEREIPRFFSKWFNRPLSEISKYEIQKIQHEVYENSGLYQANRIVERLRALYNKAIEWGWQGVNPAAKIKKYKEKSRDRFILPSEMPFIIRSLNDETNETVRDFFWILLLVGARKTNTLMMRWEQINWEHQTWHIPDTKNGEALFLPLVDKASEILKKRYTSSKSDWVFASEANKEKHFKNVKRAWKRVLQRAAIYQWASNEKLNIIVEECFEDDLSQKAAERWFCLIIDKAKDENISLPLGIMEIRIHDIRRTFGSYQAINGESLSIIGRSLGHKSQKATEVYARLNLAPVRASVEKATNAMLAVSNSFNGV